MKLVVKKNFVIFGIFVVDNKHPNRNWVLLIDESVSSLDSIDVKFQKVCSKLYVGHVPGRKCAPETEPVFGKVVPAVQGPIR